MFHATAAIAIIGLCLKEATDIKRHSYRVPLGGFDFIDLSSWKAYVAETLADSAIVAGIAASAAAAMIVIGSRTIVRV